MGIFSLLFASREEKERNLVEKQRLENLAQIGESYLTLKSKQMSNIRNFEMLYGNINSFTMRNSLNNEVIKKRDEVSSYFYTLSESELKGVALEVLSQGVSLLSYLSMTSLNYTTSSNKDPQDVLLQCISGVVVDNLHSLPSRVKDFDRDNIILDLVGVYASLQAINSILMEVELGDLIKRQLLKRLDVILALFSVQEKD